MKLIAPIVTMALLVACAAPDLGEANDTPPGEPTPAEQVTPMPPPEENGAMTGQVPEQLMARIVSDATDRTGAGEDQIEVLRAEAVTWNDGSLGCPQPDMMYTQALVDGYHVVVEAGEEELDYRADDRGHFILCDNPQDEGKPSS